MVSWTRIATLAAFLAIAAASAFAVVDRLRIGNTSATLVADGPTSNMRFVVQATRATSRLRVGDRVVIDDPADLARYQFHAFAAGTTIPVRRISPAPQVAIAEPIVATMNESFEFAIGLVEAMFLLVAAVIAARGRSSGSLQLAWLLASIVALVNPTTPAWPNWLLLGYATLGGTIAIVALTCASDFASRFVGDPEATWARRYRRIAYAIGVGSSVLNFGVSCGSFFTESTPLFVQGLAFAGITAAALAFLIGLGLALAYANAPANDRQKALWVVASLGVGIVGLVSSIVAGFFGVPEPLRNLPLPLLIAMPLGCAYAILRYRILDIAFVFNRATVFGVTSLLVLAALALVDFGLQSLLGSWLVRTGLYVQLALALAIGIATRPLHGRVDRFVDDLFFRQRHEAERTLRQFARDVAYVDDAGVVARRTVETVARAANLRCSLLLARDEGFAYVATSGDAHEADAVDRNDGGVVRMLATRAHVDLHEADTALAGDFAFPMFARNRLVGVLACGGKADGIAAYAPDELEAIGAVAHATGMALDLLRIEAVERELEELRSRGGVHSNS